MTAANNPTKKTVYVDVDEEITGIIDKVRTAKEPIVALVLPKRATVLQSVVNIKLLKRAADQANKKAVLITSEPSLLPLAGAAGLHVAANLQSRPYIPKAAAAPTPPKPEEAVSIPDDQPIDPQTPIGDLAKKPDTTDPIEIDNRPKPAATPTPVKSADKPKSPKKDKSKKIPNFQKFRLKLIIGAAVLIVLLGGFWALAMAPKANITLRTESSETQTQVEFMASPNADTVDAESGTVPAKQQELKRTEQEKVIATGEKDNGTKAAGKVTLRNCTDNRVTIPAGTGISNGGLTFITQSAIQLDDGDFNSSNQCKNNGDHVGSVNVTAQNNGDQYNLSPRTYTVAGFSGVVGQGDQMSGGTTKTVKVVSANDVETAKKKIADKQNTAVEELKSALQKDGYIGIVDTFGAGNPNYATAPAVGVESPDVTVSADITYTMLGIKESDLKKIVQEKSKDKVDTSKQSILDYGFDDATYEVGGVTRTGTDITIQTALLVGPEINQDSLKKELAGKKRADAESQLEGRPGITDATVTFSPFWVSKVPSKESKVKFTVEQSDGTKISDQWLHTGAGYR